MCHDVRMAGTLVCFHAHPDDEVIVTGGTIALAADAGHRVVLVFATRGELGEVADGVLAPSEQLADRRVVEAQRAADILGAARVEFLGYGDSGMADADQPASRLLRVGRCRRSRRHAWPTSSVRKRRRY